MFVFVGFLSLALVPLTPSKALRIAEARCDQLVFTHPMKQECEAHGQAGVPPPVVEEKAPPSEAAQVHASPISRSI